MWHNQNAGSNTLTIRTIDSTKLLSKPSNWVNVPHAHIGQWIKSRNLRCGSARKIDKVRIQYDFNTFRRGIIKQNQANSCRWILAIRDRGWNEKEEVYHCKVVVDYHSLDQGMRKERQIRWRDDPELRWKTFYIWFLQAKSERANFWYWHSRSGPKAYR